MFYKVLKPFKYSPDGIEVISYNAGDEASINEVSATNLIKRKLIKPLKKTIEATVPEIETQDIKVDVKIDGKDESRNNINDLFKKKKKKG